LKADGRIVEILADGSERPIARAEIATNGADHGAAAYAKGIRARAKLTQAEFAARIGVPIETVRNWEQGKRSPRGPARALLKMIDKVPDIAFAVLGDNGRHRMQDAQSTQDSSGGHTGVQRSRD